MKTLDIPGIKSYKKMTKNIDKGIFSKSWEACSNTKFNLFG
ncbi:MAG: hypothetical protein RBR53_01370 [Desulforegulaceae bacterium]|nr:hypothetical protein [Desulforegulaceae bacterium]